MLNKKVSFRHTSWVVDNSYRNEILQIEDPQALIAVAGYLKYNLALKQEGVFFRGQTKLYDSLCPALYRGVFQVKTRSDRSEEINNFIKIVRDKVPIFQQFGNYTYEPLLQHYGISTTWIDVVDNIWIALWFACHKAHVSGKNKQYLHYEKRHLDKNEYAYILLISADMSQRDKTKPGFFFGKKTELVDLRMATPGIFLRPHSQHGLLFRRRGETTGTARPNNYMSSVEAILRIPLDKALLWLGQGYTVDTHFIFPSPYYDHGYNILLSTELEIPKILGSITYVGA